MNLILIFILAVAFFTTGEARECTGLAVTSNSRPSGKTRSLQVKRAFQNHKVVDYAWNKINNTYPDGASYVATKVWNNWGVGPGIDRVKVTRGNNDNGNSACHITCQDTTEMGDWINNFDFMGAAEIEQPSPIVYYSYDQTNNFLTTPIRRCSQRVFGLWNAGCKDTLLGQGTSGFVRAYNALKDQVYDKIRTRCENYGTTDFVYSGYSRGGAICSVFAFAHMRDGWFGSSNGARRVELVTFGAPRVLIKQESDWLQGQLHNSYRIANWGPDISKNDPVPTTPPSGGYIPVPGTFYSYELVIPNTQHVGKTRYGKLNNGNTIGQNEPTLINAGAQQCAPASLTCWSHTSYGHEGLCGYPNCFTDVCGLN